ncbi:MAG: T9SS type A sorting domain-containing protein [Bacteroidota bacterium]
MKTHYLITLLFFLSPLLSAQDGSLDPAFGNNGLVVIDDSNGDARLLSVLKSGDQLMATGHTTVDGQEVITIVRFNLNGSLDMGFSNSGYVNVPLGTGNGRATSIIEQVDGKFIVGGYARFSNKEQYVLIRILADGTLDSSFGVDGVATGSFSQSSFAEDEIDALALMSDGRIVVAGRSYNGQDPDGFIACFNTDGSLNTDFGTDGFVLVRFDISPPSEQITAMVIDAEDNIIVGGTVATGFNTERAQFLRKIKSDGEVDLSFGDEGSVVLAIDPDVAAGMNTMALDNEGRILTAGGAFDFDEIDNDFFLTRYLPNGSADPAFGNDGLVILRRGSNEAVFDLQVGPTGDIFAAGSTGGFPSSFAIVRLGNNGQQDLSFGDNGWALAQAVFGFNSLQSIVLDEACIYGAGYVQEDDEWKIALGKFINQGLVNTTEPFLQENTLILSPNPTTEQFQLSFELSKEENLSIQLYDAQGRAISELLSRQPFSQGEQQIPLALPTTLPTGPYFLVLNFEEDQVIRQLIKQ